MLQGSGKGRKSRIVLQIRSSQAMDLGICFGVWVL